MSSAHDRLWQLRHVDSNPPRQSLVSNFAADLRPGSRSK